LTRLTALTRLGTLTRLTALTRLGTLTRLTALTTLTGLTAWLPRLAVACKLAGLVLLSARLTCSSRLTLSGTSAEAGELVAQTGQVVHRAVERCLLGIVLCTAHGAGRILDALTQFLQLARELGFGLIGEFAVAELIRTALHSGAEIVFIDALKGAPQFGRGAGLRRREFARGGTQLLGQPLQIVAHFLAIIDHFVDFLGGRIGLRLTGGTRGILLSHQVSYVIGLLLLPGRQLIGCLGHRVEAAGGILLLRSTKQIGGLPQAISGAARIGRAGILRDGALHVVVGLAQAVERLLRLLRCLLAAVGGLLRGLLRR
jgi:hypothetical protein